MCLSINRGRPCLLSARLELCAVSSAVVVLLHVCYRDCQTAGQHYSSIAAQATANGAKAEELALALGQTSRELEHARTELARLSQTDAEQHRELQRLERCVRRGWASLTVPGLREPPLANLPHPHVTVHSTPSFSFVKHPSVRSTPPFSSTMLTNLHTSNVVLNCSHASGYFVLMEPVQGELDGKGPLKQATGGLEVHWRRVDGAIV